MPNGPNRFVMATNPLHFLASRTQAQAFRAGIGRWMRRREFFAGMYTFLVHKAKDGISDQCLEHIAGFAGLPQEDRRLVSQAGVVLTQEEADGMVYHTWSMKGWLVLPDTVGG